MSFFKLLLILFNTTIKNTSFGKLNDDDDFT